MGIFEYFLVISSISIIFEYFRVVRAFSSIWYLLVPLEFSKVDMCLRHAIAIFGHLLLIFYTLLADAAEEPEMVPATLKMNAQRKEA